MASCGEPKDAAPLAGADAAADAAVLPSWVVPEYGDQGAIVFGRFQASTADLGSDGDLLVGGGEFDPVDGPAARHYLTDGRRDDAYGEAGVRRFDAQHYLSGIFLRRAGKGARIVAAQFKSFDPAYAVAVFAVTDRGELDPATPTLHVPIARSDMPSFHTPSLPRAVELPGERVLLATSEAGTTTLLRLTTTGLDRSFGDQGVLRSDLARTLETIERFDPLSDGRVLATGRSRFGQGIIRLDADGKVDPTYGLDGIVALPRAGDPRVAVAVDRRDGSAYVGEGSVVVRLDERGARDPRFTTGPEDGVPDPIAALTLDGEGRLLVLRSDGRLQRRTREGALDRTFHGSGEIDPRVCRNTPTACPANLPRCGVGGDTLAFRVVSPERALVVTYGCVLAIRL